MRIFEKIKEKRYWKKRAKLWANFKNENDISKIQCGLVKDTKKYTPWSWEYECHNCSYNRDFFEKYGCMYIRDFMNY